MLKLFFYGTLMDRQILRSVAGDDILGRFLGDAILKDYQAFYVLDEDYPVLQPKPGMEVRGHLYLVATKDELDRLMAYEGDEYVLGPIKTSLGDAKAFLPSSLVEVSDLPWKS